MSDMHSFSVGVAKEVGVNAAILLQSIKWWCEKNRANGKHFHDGLYWTYNSVKAWQELYPYIGKSAIDSALKKLEERGFIKVGNYNKSAYDRTKWYAITDDGLCLFGDSISGNREMEEQESGNGFGENQEPIPVTSQFPSTTYLTDSIVRKPKKHPTIEEVKAHVQEKGYHFDAQHFFDYYSTSGWKMQNGKPVKSWKQCCVTWERNWSKANPQPTGRLSDYNFAGREGTDTVVVSGDAYDWSGADEIRF